jgi:Amt family ammonium transporter
VDLSLHAETAYAFGELGSRFHPLGQRATAQLPAPEAAPRRGKEDSFA